MPLLSTTSEVRRLPAQGGTWIGVQVALRLGGIPNAENNIRTLVFGTSYSDDELREILRQSVCQLRTYAHNPEGHGIYQTGMRKSGMALREFFYNLIQGALTAQEGRSSPRTTRTNPRNPRSNNCGSSIENEFFSRSPNTPF